MDVDYSFKNDELVDFDNGVIAGRGYVVGACNTGHPIIGITYMIDVDKANVKFPNKTYPYNIIPVNECHISKIDN